MPVMAQADYRSGGTSAPHPDIPKTGNDVALLARDAFDRNVWCVLGLPVDIATIDSAVGDIAMAAQGRRRLSFVTPNVNWLVRSWREAGVRREILDADLSLIDGAPLLFFARLLGAPAPSRAAGSDLFDALRRRPAYGGRKLKVYFFGGRDGAAEAAARAIEDENGPLEAVGWRNPGFGDVEAMSADEHIDHINAADPDFVVVSLGAAKGQAWIDANKARLNAPVTAHLGAVVDFTAGGIARAPEWMRRAGLEWLWRIKEEPSLWRRYYKDGVALAGLVLRHLVTQLGAAQTIDASAAGEASFLPASGLPASGGGLSTVRLVGALGRGNMMAAAFERQDNITFAQAELAKALDVSERDPDIANRFARFLIRNGNSSRAEEVLVNSLAAHEGDLDNLRLLAGVRLNNQDWRGAEEVARIIETVEQDEANDDQLVDTIRAEALAGLGEYDRVIETLEARRDAGPLASRPLATLVNAYMRSDRAADAEALLQRVAASGDNSYEARILLARVYGAQGENDQAEAVLIEATEADPARAPAYELLYRYYIRVGQNDRAAALIDDGLAKAPDNVALRVFKADTLIASGDLEGALTIYEGLLETRPNDLIIANNFVSLSSDLRLDEASIAKALEVSRVVERADNPLFRDTVGWAHYRAGDYAKAVEYLTEAAEGAPENAEILYHLGAAQAAAGDIENARANLQKALEAGGDGFARSQEAQTILQGL